MLVPGLLQASLLLGHVKTPPCAPTAHTHSWLLGYWVFTSQKLDASRGHLGWKTEADTHTQSRVSINGKEVRSTCRSCYFMVLLGKE